MNQAVVKIGAKQYLVFQDQKLVVDRLPGKAKDKVVLDQVLLKLNGDKLVLGQPQVKGAKVEALILAQNKGKKIRVAKFKAKSRYRRVRGHRERLTELQIVKI